MYQLKPTEKCFDHLLCLETAPASEAAEATAEAVDMILSEIVGKNERRKSRNRQKKQLFSDRDPIYCLALLKNNPTNFSVSW